MAPEGPRGPKRGRSNWRSVGLSESPGSFQDHLGAKPRKGLSPQAPGFGFRVSRAAADPAQHPGPSVQPPSSLLPSFLDPATRLKSLSSASRLPRQSADRKPKLSMEYQTDRGQKCDLSPLHYLSSIHPSIYPFFYLS